MRVLLAALCLVTLPGTAEGQSRGRTRDEYDDIFRKYSKRYFGPGSTASALRVPPSAMQ